MNRNALVYQESTVITCAKNRTRNPRSSNVQARVTSCVRQPAAAQKGGHSNYATEPAGVNGSYSYWRRLSSVARPTAASGCTHSVSVWSGLHTYYNVSAVLWTEMCDLVWYVCRPNSYLLKFIYLSSEQSPISSVHMCDVSRNELMKAVQQTAYWYCARSMQNGVYDSDGTIWLQEKTIGKIRYYTKISRYNTIRYSTSDHAVAVSTNKGSCDQIC